MGRGCETVALCSSLGSANGQSPQMRTLYSSLLLCHLLVYLLQIALQKPVDNDTKGNHELAVNYNQNN